MQPTIETQLNAARTKLMPALMPNGFKTTEYHTSGCNGNASLTITMIDESVTPVRTLNVSITDVCDESPNSVRRLVKVAYSLTEMTIDSESMVTTAERMHGSTNHTLTPNERCKYNTGEFLTSNNGIEILSQARICIQNRCKTLDLLARADKLVQTAHTILKADKDLHKTLLDANCRQELCNWLTRRASLSETKLEAWVIKGEKLQKKPLATLKAAAQDGQATHAQLQKLANKFSPKRLAS